MMNDSYINNLIKRYCSNDTVHSVLFVKYKDIFDKVMDRINNPDKYKEFWSNNIKPNQNDMILRLKQEIIESENMCFTGQLTRLVNSLVGFYSDININISSSDQINARINNILNNCGQLSQSEQKEKIIESLREIEVDENVINEWIENIWHQEENYKN
jgi:hypothetical protein